MRKISTVSFIKKHVWKQWNILTQTQHFLILDFCKQMNPFSMPNNVCYRLCRNQNKFNWKIVGQVPDWIVYGGIKNFVLLIIQEDINLEFLTFIIQKVEIMQDILVSLLLIPQHMKVIGFQLLLKIEILKKMFTLELIWEWFIELVKWK